MYKRILYAVLLILILPDIAAIDIFGGPADLEPRYTLKDYLADPGIQNVYQECSHHGWPIVARLGNLRQPDPLPSKSVLYLFVKNSTVDIHTEYFRTAQGRYVLFIAFPADVVDKTLIDLLKK
jgi:hypothetical protein